MNLTLSYLHGFPDAEELDEGNLEKNGRDLA